MSNNNNKNEGQRASDPQSGNAQESLSSPVRVEEHRNLMSSAMALVEDIASRLGQVIRKS